MKLEAVPFTLSPEDLIPDQILYPPQPRRVDLPHLSPILRDLERVTGRAKRYGDDLTPEDRNRRRAYFAMGFAWEMCMEAAFKMRQMHGFSASMIRQPEIEHKGILSTGDLLDTEDWRYVELKFTTRSSRHVEELEENFWVWFQQMRWNCAAWQTNKAALFVLFGCGNYKPPTPDARGWRIEFSDGEIADTETMVTNHRDRMSREGRLR